MAFLAVSTVLLFFFAALGQTFWWRTPAPAPWYGSAVFYWGIFCLAAYITWPTIKSLL